MCNQGKPHEAQWHKDMTGSGEGRGMAVRKTVALGTQN